MPSTLIASSLSVSLVVSHNKYSSTKDEKLEISQRLDVKTSRNMTKNRKDRVHCVPSGRKRCRIDRRGSGKTHRLGEVASTRRSGIDSCVPNRCATDSLPNAELIRGGKKAQNQSASLPPSDEAPCSVFSYRLFLYSAL